jgi:hypothetical protein
MADYRAVVAVGEAIIQLLRQHYRFADFNNELDFRIYLAKDFAEPMNAGVSVFLYRIFPNGTQKNHTWRASEGLTTQNQLPVDLHFLLSAWAQDASLQHTIAGWMMRTLQDTPVIPAGILNQRFPGLFRTDEIITLGPAELTTEELFRMWEVIVNHSYQLSVPYVARSVRIEAILGVAENAEPVRERVFDSGQIGGGGA